MPRPKPPDRSIRLCAILATLTVCTCMILWVRSPPPGTSALSPLPPERLEHRKTPVPSSSNERAPTRRSETADSATRNTIAPTNSATELAQPIDNAARTAAHPPQSGLGLLVRPNSISGTIRFIGTPPAEKKLPLGPECREAQLATEATDTPTTRFYRVGTDGGLADVVVTLIGEQLRSTPIGLTNALRIDQRGCVFEPYVSACQAGTPIRVFNSDPVLHSVHATPRTVESGNPMSQALPPGANPIEFVLRKPAPFVRIKCDVHPWMFAYVTVVSHRHFAVTDERGHYEIPLPSSGHYRIAANHRKLGTITRSLTVKDARPIHEDFAFPLPEAQSHAGN